MKASIERVPPARVSEIWHEVEDWIAAAVQRSKDESVQFVHDECRCGAAQLWIAKLDNAITGVFVTEIQRTDRRRILELRYLAGLRLRDWIVCQPILERWARSYGCAAMRIRGRYGWTRFLKPFGWKSTAFEMERAI